MSPRRVWVVPHTHWDREWYRPFQTMRLRLVAMLDGLVRLMEADPSFRRFLLDGQMAVLDDYLAVRPEAEGAVRRLCASGRVTVGPWYVLMDEFLVSGETIVRNLQMGLHRAADFGGAMAVGYLPDSFGHAAQMPQILRLAGLEHAVVWRGVPSEVDRSAFWWSSPDGSTVRAEHLVRGYGNGAAIPDDAEALVRRVADHDREVGAGLAGAMLFMNGTDHRGPDPWVGRVVAEANRIQDAHELVVSSLPEALASAPTDALPSWQGELRSGARADLLTGVTSNHVDVKQSAARAEAALERRAEPLCALFLGPARWPGAELDLAWKEVVLNSAHDSICACSVDEVVADVLHRYASSRQIADGLADRALEGLRASLREPGPTAVNWAGRARGGVVEILVPAGDVPDGCQRLRDDDRVPAYHPASGPSSATEVRSMLGAIRDQQLAPGLFVDSLASGDRPGTGTRIVVGLGSSLRPNPGVEQAKREIYSRLGADPDAPVELEVTWARTARVVTRVEDVPACGWRRVAPAVPRDPVTVQTSSAGTVMRNALAEVDVDTTDGTVCLDGARGLNRLVDGGDQGDTYSYSPPGADTVVDSPDSVEVEVLEHGPVRARVRVVRTYRWPERIDATGARAGEVTVPVTSVVELRAGESLVRVETSFVNCARDHRLRAVFPLPVPAQRSRAECAFAVVERGVSAEGGPRERGVPAFPSRRFVSAGGLTVLHEGLNEYELVDIGDGGSAGAIALTLLRSTGMLSRASTAYRRDPAGPTIPVDGAQLQGPVLARYAVLRGEDDPYRAADDAFSPLDVVDAPGGGTRPPAGSELAVDGAELSSVRRASGALEVRVFNPRPEEHSVSFGGRIGHIVDLRGQVLSPFEGELLLGPWEIATVRIEGP